MQAHDNPLPSEEATPPVTKMNFVGRAVIRPFFLFLQPKRRNHSSRSLPHLAMTSISESRMDGDFSISSKRTIHEMGKGDSAVILEFPAPSHYRLGRQERELMSRKL